jgi:branched-chain amino acid aminotransferase
MRKAGCKPILIFMCLSLGAHSLTAGIPDCRSLLAVNAGVFLSLDGTIVERGAVSFSPYASTLLYGTGAFDTARVYRHDSGRLAVFRLKDHLERLRRTAGLAGLSPLEPTAVLEGHVVATVRANGFGESFIRMSVLLDEGPVGLLLGDRPPQHALVLNWEWGQYHGAQGTAEGIKALVSRFTRHHGEEVNAKLIGNYAMATIARAEAHKQGFAESILLDEKGMVAEATGENVFIVRDGQLKTPREGAILMGVTRSTVLWSAGQLSIPHQEAPFSQEELLLADEVFLSGTAAEIVPVTSINGIPIGAGIPGPITLRLQTHYADLVRGRLSQAPVEWFSFLQP